MIKRRVSFEFEAGSASVTIRTTYYVMGFCYGVFFVCVLCVIILQSARKGEKAPETTPRKVRLSNRVANICCCESCMFVVRIQAESCLAYPSYQVDLLVRNFFDLEMVQHEADAKRLDGFMFQFYYYCQVHRKSISTRHRLFLFRTN